MAFGNFSWQNCVQHFKYENFIASIESCCLSNSRNIPNESIVSFIRIIFLRREWNLLSLILSKEKNAVVTSRGKKLNIEVIQGCDDKLPELIQWLKKNNVDAQHAAYIGNDINDLECLGHVGVAAIPADAHSSVVATANWILQHNGGRGAIREFADGIVESLSSNF